MVGMHMVQGKQEIIVSSPLMSLTTAPHQLQLPRLGHCS